MWLSLMKPMTLRPVICSNFRRHVFLHNALPASAQIEHRVSFAGIGESLLTAGHGVLQYDEHAVLAERRLCLVGPRPVVRASAWTTVFEIAAASSPSVGLRSLFIAALRGLGPQGSEPVKSIETRVDRI